MIGFRPTIRVKENEALVRYTFVSTRVDVTLGSLVMYVVYDVKLTRLYAEL